MPAGQRAHSAEFGSIMLRRRVCGVCAAGSLCLADREVADNMGTRRDGKVGHVDIVSYF